MIQRHMKAEVERASLVKTHLQKQKSQACADAAAEVQFDISTASHNSVGHAKSAQKIFAEIERSGIIATSPGLTHLDLSQQIFTIAETDAEADDEIMPPVMPIYNILRNGNRPFITDRSQGDMEVIRENDVLIVDLAPLWNFSGSSMKTFVVGQDCKVIEGDIIQHLDRILAAAELKLKVPHLLLVKNCSDMFER